MYYHYIVNNYSDRNTFGTSLYIMAISFSGGRSRSTRREPPTMDKQLVNFITCGCESSAPFCNLQSRARTPERTNDLPQVTDKLYHIKLHRVHLPMNGVQITTLGVIDTDCTGS
jgi:hypothetical protein